MYERRGEREQPGLVEYPDAQVIEERRGPYGAPVQGSDHGSHRRIKNEIKDLNKRIQELNQRRT